MEPQFRFCKSQDGTRIAYGVLGSGPPLLLVYSWGNSLDFEWQEPTCRSFMERVGLEYTIIMVTRRGIGGSDRDVADLSLEAQTADIAAVAEAMGLGTFDLWSFSDANAPAVAYAVQNPDRVGRVILWDLFANGIEIVTQSSRQSLLDMVRSNWPMARRALVSLIFPNGPLDAQRWLSHQWEHNVTPDMCARYLEFMGDVEITSLLSELEKPCLVLHRRGDRAHPLATGRAAAALLPDGRFHTLEGDISYAQFGDTAYLELVFAFLAEGRAEPLTEPAPQPPLRTILFTDIEGHTAIMRRLGDELGRAVLREHERRTREALQAHGGHEIKSMGDGFMASFGSVQAALNCATALQRTFTTAACAGEHIRVRIGLNAGEPIEEEDDLFGSSVILAARASAQAGGGQILVTNVVRELASGKRFRFHDAGEFSLRGFDDPVRLYELTF